MTIVNRASFGRIGAERRAQRRAGIWLDAFRRLRKNKLALLYTIASVRAGTWIIPAFHSPIDAGIRGGHDDPQNFDLNAFAESLERLRAKLRVSS